MHFDRILEIKKRCAYRGVTFLEEWLWCTKVNSWTAFVLIREPLNQIAWVLIRYTFGTNCQTCERTNKSHDERIVYVRTEWSWYSGIFRAMTSQVLAWWLSSPNRRSSAWRYESGLMVVNGQQIALNFKLKWVKYCAWTALIRGDRSMFMDDFAKVLVCCSIVWI